MPSTARVRVAVQNNFGDLFRCGGKSGGNSPTGIFIIIPDASSGDRYVPDLDGLYVEKQKVDDCGRKVVVAAKTGVIAASMANSNWSKTTDTDPDNQPQKSDVGWRSTT